ncbi:hypothetical protein AAW01_11665 [Aurantiacibacter gangjinensis]|uniref:Uncharacterized protein n=1 Tax=Aurantiacibacter gangjinensis TaxID=502682 RepID=A0A0G9MMY1_9SPHN|nr:hypothetical protein AAW01_11665 [Aurantiacibacter gangjinensis]
MFEHRQHCVEIAIRAVQFDIDVAVISRCLVHLRHLSRQRLDRKAACIADENGKHAVGHHLADGEALYPVPWQRFLQRGRTADAFRRDFHFGAFPHRKRDGNQAGGHGEPAHVRQHLDQHRTGAGAAGRATGKLVGIGQQEGQVDQRHNEAESNEKCDDRQHTDRRSAGGVSGVGCHGSSPIPGECDRPETAAAP